MTALAQKMREVEAEIASERGGIVLFALFEREDSAGKWDVVISATWVGRSEKDDLDYVINKIQPRLKPPELLAMSRVIVLSPDEPFVQFVHAWVHVKQGFNEFVNCTVNGMHITHAYVITSEPALPAVFDVEGVEEETRQLLEAMHPDAAQTEARIPAQGRKRPRR